MTARLIDRACNALAYVLVAPVFAVCRLFDPAFCRWSNQTHVGD